MKFLFNTYRPVTGPYFRFSLHAFYERKLRLALERKFL